MFFFFQAEDGIRDHCVTGVQTCALPILRAVIAESFERIHRSNLVNMGVLPLQFKAGESASSLKLTGTESYGIAVADLKPRATVAVRIQPAAGSPFEVEAVVRIDTPEELTAFRHGGILPYVLR